MSQLRANAPAARRKLFQRLTLAAVAIVLVAAALWVWNGRKAASSEAALRTAPVERGDIRVALSATGTLSAISTVTVGSQVSGQVTRILVDFNSQVKQGQVPARIDASTYEAQIQQGNAQVEARWPPSR
ncbi:MAG: biotin/lipoyl-binding protein [Pseudoxanthomonas sp.]|nr:biotin/lipoyl-binding protein [Pseudoxanthomonas sp.]